MCAGVLREATDVLPSRKVTAFATLEAVKAEDCSDELIWAVAAELEFVSLGFFICPTLPACP